MYFQPVALGLHPTAILGREYQREWLGGTVPSLRAAREKGSFMPWTGLRAVRSRGPEEDTLRDGGLRRSLSIIEYR